MNLCTSWQDIRERMPPTAVSLVSDKDRDEGPALTYGHTIHSESVMKTRRQDLAEAVMDPRCVP